MLTRLRDATRVALAWASIVDDVENNRLNIDKNQLTQAEKELQAANAVLPRSARECFKWLLCPVQDDPGAKRPTVEPFPLNTTSGTAQGELERVCRENELVIETWSPIHLRAKLQEALLEGRQDESGRRHFGRTPLPTQSNAASAKTQPAWSSGRRTGSSSRPAVCSLLLLTLYSSLFHFRGGRKERVKSEE